MESGTSLRSCTLVLLCSVVGRLVEGMGLGIDDPVGVAFPDGWAVDRDQSSRSERFFSAPRQRQGATTGVGRGIAATSRRSPYRLRQLYAF